MASRETSGRSPSQPASSPMLTRASSSSASVNTDQEAEEVDEDEAEYLTRLVNADRSAPRAEGRRAGTSSPMAQSREGEERTLLAVDMAGELKVSCASHSSLQ